jgi:hypothetical protein
MYVDCEGRDQGQGPDWVRVHRPRCPVRDPGEEMHPTDLPRLPLPHSAGINWYDSDASPWYYLLYVLACMYVCVSQLKKGPGGIAYNHFLQAYNPTHAHHELDGASLSRSTLLLPNNFNQGQSVSFSDDISMGTSAFAGDLKRVWHDVLKECHRADPERNGQVSKATFIDALQKADAAKVRDHYYCLGHK